MLDRCLTVFSVGRLALFSLALLAHSELRASEPPRLVYETTNEFFGTGDFDGDGHADMVIVDKESGKLRLGYQLTNGFLAWQDNRPSGLKQVSGFSIGKLLDA